MIFGKFDERTRPSDRVEPKVEIKTEPRKTPPMVLEPAPHPQGE